MCSLSGVRCCALDARSKNISDGDFSFDSLFEYKSNRIKSNWAEMKWIVSIVSWILPIPFWAQFRFRNQLIFNMAKESTTFFIEMCLLFAFTGAEICGFASNGHFTMRPAKFNSNYIMLLFIGKYLQSNCNCAAYELRNRQQEKARTFTHSKSIRVARIRWTVRTKMRWVDSFRSCCYCCFFPK